MTLLVLHGPNLNLLGRREPAIYGTDTLADLSRRLDALAGELSVALEHFQSNHEGALVDRVHAAAASGASGVLLNAAAYGHTSIALRDALLGTGLPFVEVHVTNVARRERFRQRGLLADVAVGLVQGFGTFSYDLGLRALVHTLRSRSPGTEVGPAGGAEPGGGV